VKRVRGALLVLSVVGLAVAGCSSGNDATVHGGSFTFTSPGGLLEYSYPAGKRQQIGALSGPDLTGKKTIDVADYRGKIVVLNFWGSWCAPCRGEAQGLEAVAQKYKGEAQFVGIDVKDTAQDALAFSAGKQITYPSIFDPGMRTMLSVRGLPTINVPVTMVLDKQGRVAHIWLLPVTGGDLDTVITALASEV
jgi:thiol-disulfide isomerase/thioredoxin